MKLTADQQIRFKQLAAMSGRSPGTLSHEYEAAFYIMSLQKELFIKAGSYVSESGIDFERCLEEQEFSAGLRVMLHLAHNLFCDGSEDRISPVDLMILDKENFEGALEAIRIRGAKIW